MARIITNILLCFISLNIYCQQKPLFMMNNQTPVSVGSNVSIFSFRAKTGNDTILDTLGGITAGARIVITCASELDGSISNATVSSTPVLTWTKVADGPGTAGAAEIYTAVSSSGGTLIISTGWGGAFHQSECAYQILSQEATPGGNSATGPAGAGAGQNVAQAVISSTRINSILICVTSNWNGIDGGTNGSSIVFSGTAFKTHYASDPLRATMVHFYYNATTVQSYTCGFTSPVDTDFGSNTSVYEIRGN